MPINGNLMVKSLIRRNIFCNGKQWIRMLGYGEMNAVKPTFHRFAMFYVFNTKIYLIKYTKNKGYLL